MVLEMDYFQQQKNQLLNLYQIYIFLIYQKSKMKTGKNNGRILRQWKSIYIFGSTIFIFI
jgi:hypothetical protein